jgi:hypothetical protein
MSSPYDTMFVMPSEGVLKQELITYKIVNGMLKKITVTRKFFNNDYLDNETIEPLCQVAPTVEVLNGKK